MEQIIKDLNFDLVVRVRKKPGGYDLQLSTDWNGLRGMNPNFVVRLTGMNPLTGKDVSEDGLSATFSTYHKETVFENLKYHGTFVFRSFLLDENKQEHPVAEYPVELDFPENRPQLFFRFTREGDYGHMNIECNCWDFCKGKAWLEVDGHRQPLRLPQTTSGSYSFYLATSAKPNIKIDDPIIKAEERKNR